MTCDGLASRPGGVEILLAASCYGNRDKFRQHKPVGFKASLFFKRCQNKNNTIIDNNVFQLSTLKGTVKASAVEPFETKHPKRYQNHFINPCIPPVVPLYIGSSAPELTFGLWGGGGGGVTCLPKKKNHTMPWRSQSSLLITWVSDYWQLIHWVSVKISTQMHSQIAVEKMFITFTSYNHENVLISKITLSTG